MELNSSNYFSPENNRKYMGSSQFKTFMDCEARAMAEINGEYKSDETVALLAGSYIDSWFEGTLPQFKADHPEIFTVGGKLKKEFSHVDYIIERIQRDELFMQYMGGRKQVIKTGEICGVPFKIKIDSYHPGKAIVDLKLMKNFEPIWKEGFGKLSFIEAWGYDIQGAIYQAVEGNRLPFFIDAVTKEKEPDMALIQIPQSRLDLSMEIVSRYVGRFQSIKNSKIDPIRCEKCDYCKRTKVLTEILSMEDFE